MLLKLDKQIIVDTHPGVRELVASLHAEECSVNATETHVDACLSVDCYLHFFSCASLTVVDKHSKLKADFSIRLDIYC